MNPKPHIFSTLYTLQLPSTSSQDENLKILLSYIKNCQENSIILAPEVFLSGFLYSDMQGASDFSVLAKGEILKHCQNKVLLLSMIEKGEKDMIDKSVMRQKDDAYYNIVNVFYNNKIIYTQGKSRLFKPGGEHLYFKNADDSDVRIFNIDGLKCGILNCFEIRFLHLWQRLNGADIIFTPASWALSRRVHFESITRTIAIINQCYVVASCSANENLTKSSAIITPNGEVEINPSASVLEMAFEYEKILKAREKIDTTIH